MADAHPIPGDGAPSAPSNRRAFRAQRWGLVLRWGVVPALVGGGLLIALLNGALLGGAREAVLRAAVTLGAGHLTVQPIASGGSAVSGTATVRGLIRESGEVYTNLALMRLTASGVRTGGQVTGRLELPVEIATQLRTGSAHGEAERREAKHSEAEHREAADLTGLENADDPQALLLRRFLVAGAWSADPASGDSAAGVVLSAGLAESLGVSTGDLIGIRAGSGSTLRAVRGRVTGIVRTGLPRIDRGRLWTGAVVARELLPLPRDAREEAVSLLAVYLEQPERAVEWLTAVRRYTLPAGVEILTWRQMDPNALPWEPLILAQRRAMGIGLGAAGGGALLAALIAMWAAPHGGRTLMRLSARRLLMLAGPPLLGLTLGVLIYSALWGLNQNAPLPAAQAFAWFDPALNPYGALTGPVRLDLAAGQALRWLGTCLVVYGVVSVSLAWVLSQRRSA